MPPLPWKAASSAVVTLLGLAVWGGTVWCLESPMREASPAPRSGDSGLLWVMTASVWLVLGYALGWLSRPPAPGPAWKPAAPPERSPRGPEQLSTEQLFHELRRMNHAALAPEVNPTGQAAETRLHSC